MSCVCVCVCVPSLPDYISWAEFLLRIVFMFNFLSLLWVSAVFWLAEYSRVYFHDMFFFAFIFQVTKAHTLYRTILHHIAPYCTTLHQGYTLDVAYKKLRSIEKEPSQVREAPLFSAEKHAVTWLFRVFSFDDLSYMNQIWWQPLFYTRHLLLLTFGEVILYMSLFYWFIECDNLKWNM
jgi:hypothetical protein